MKRFFIVGAPRSGTTLLQSMVGCAPGMTTFRESHLYSRGLTLRGGMALALRAPSANAARFCAENQIAGVMPGLSPLARLRSGAVAEYFVRILDGAARAQACKIWLEKMPRHLHYTRWIEARAARFTGGATGQPVQFIYLVRDGVAVALSLVRASEGWRVHHAPGL